jgi:2-polyprenyl-3-methyl-5-hydroxy-6-metoxy-1,4-benzoquinol methylase
MQTLVTQWDAWHQERQDFEDTHTGPPLPLAEWREMALAMLGSVQGLRVLDVGCARGGFCRALADRGANVTGVDLSPRAVELARERVAGTSARIEVADAYELPFADDSFDVVSALETPHHVADVDALLAECARVLRPGGRIVLSTENCLSLAGFGELLIRLLRRDVTTAPVRRLHTTFAIRRALRRHGCRVDALMGGSHLLVLPGLETRQVEWLERLPAAAFFAYQISVLGTKRSVGPTHVSGEGEQSRDYPSARSAG